VVEAVPFLKQKKLKERLVKEIKEELIKKRLESRKGYKHSEETKRKIGEANKRFWNEKKVI
jgi:hypothetical protein